MQTTSAITVPVLDGEQLAGIHGAAAIEPFRSAGLAAIDAQKDMFYGGIKAAIMTSRAMVQANPFLGAWVKATIAATKHVR